MRYAVAIAIALLLGCASTPPPETSAPLAWAGVAGVEVPQIVTVDPDGDIRETKLWLVVVDGTGFIRTGNTRWFRNIERDPNVVLRIGGHSYPLRAELEVDAARRRAAMAAFRSKYGLQDRMASWVTSGENANILRLVPRP